MTVSMSKGPTKMALQRVSDFSMLTERHRWWWTCEMRVGCIEVSLSRRRSGRCVWKMVPHWIALDQATVDGVIRGPIQYELVVTIGEST